MTSLNPDIFVSVILPCRNVTNIIESVIFDLHDLLIQNYSYFEIVVVDDHSNDDFKGKIKKILIEKNNIRSIRFNRFYGQDITISAGLDSAIGDVVVVLDPNKDPLNNLVYLIKKCYDDGCILYGIISTHPRFRPVRSLMAKIFAWYCRQYLKIDIQSRSGIFRIFNRSSVNAFMQAKSRVRNLRIFLANSGATVCSFTYEPIYRQGSSNKSFSESLFDDINRSFDILVSTSQHPLRWLSRFGVMAAFLNLFYCIYVLTIFLIKRHVAEGWVTLSLQSAGMFCLLFVILSVLCEYVGKILTELAQGPLYIVEE